MFNRVEMYHFSGHCQVFAGLRTCRIDDAGEKVYDIDIPAGQAWEGKWKKYATGKKT